MRINIGTKLITGFMLIVLMMVALSFYFVSVSRKSLEQCVVGDSIFLAEEMMRGIDRAISLYIEQLQTYLEHPLLQKTVLESNKEFERLNSIEKYINRKDREWVSAPGDEITPFMMELIRNELSRGLRMEFTGFYRVFGQIFVTNKYGANVAQTGKTTDYRQDDEDWWQIVKEKGLYVSDVVFDKSASIHGISIGLRVHDEQGEFIGVMKAVLAAKKIIKEAEVARKKYETTRIKLITKDGRFIYRTKAFRFLEDISGTPFFKQIKGRKGSFIGKAGGIERLYSYVLSQGYRDFKGLGWILVVGHGVAEVLEPSISLRNNLTAASLILVIISILFAFYVSRSITKPLTLLSKSAEKIGEGDLGHRVNVKTKDEIGSLAAAFNRMAKKLQEADDALIKTYQELKEAQEKLVRQEKLAVLGQLAGGVGHELRNPLGAIKNAAYFLNMAVEEPEPEVKEALEILDKEVAESEKIISSLLDFARPKSPTRRKTDVNHVVLEALSRVTVPENVEVMDRLAKTLPIILADPDQLGRVFENLIRNACQAMREGGQLGIKTSAGSVEQPEVESPKWVTVSFTDTGVGIPETDREKVFEPLFTTKAKGIGLGLALTRTLVEGHRGTIEVESDVGKGSTFTVRLPAGDKLKRQHGK